MVSATHRAHRVLALVMVLAACGDDSAVDDSSSNSTAETSESGTASGTDTASETDTATETETGGEADIVDELAALPGLTVIEQPSAVGGTRFFHLFLRVPIDHDDPSAGDFELFVTLHHRSREAPMVMHTTGYAISPDSYEVELSSLVGGNQLIVEKRFNGASVPDAAWSVLDAHQVAGDGHVLVETLRLIYTGPWLRTGGSLGGEDAVYHHYYHPNDFVGVVSYVAPFVLGLADARFIDHFQTQVPQDCQDNIEQLQVVMLGAQRQAMLTELQARLMPNELTLIGGHDPALETLVLEFAWITWQWNNPSLCGLLPSPDDPNLDALLLTDLLDQFVGMETVTDAFFELYFAYAYQAFTQLGRPAQPIDHLQGLVDPNYYDLETAIPPPGEPLPFDDGFIPAIHAWLAGEASDVIFIYGGLDPWVAGRVDVGANPGVATYILPTGNHGTGIADLDGSEQTAIEAQLGAWIGSPLGHLPPTPQPQVRHPR